MTDMAESSERDARRLDPMAMTGIDYLKAYFLERRAGPIGGVLGLLGITCRDVREGFVAFELTPGPQHNNPLEVVHGGVAGTLLDSAMGCAVHSTLPEKTSYVTLELKVNFVKAIRVQTGPVTCEARVIHAGKRVALAEGRVMDAAGALYAHGTCTCLIVERLP